MMRSVTTRQSGILQDKGTSLQKGEAARIHNDADKLTSKVSKGPLQE